MEKGYWALFVMETSIYETTRTKLKNFPLMNMEPSTIKKIKVLMRTASPNRLTPKVIIPERLFLFLS